MRVNGYQVIGNKIKMTYESFEWNQHKPDMDVFENINQVKAYCGNFGDSVEETACWLDTFNWSIMNKTRLTEDIYQFISHRSGIVRRSIDKEIDQFQMDWTVLSPLKDTVVSGLKNGSSALIDLIF